MYLTICGSKSRHRKGSIQNLEPKLVDLKESLNGDCNLKHRNQMDCNIPSAEKVWVKEGKSGKFGAEKWEDQRVQSWQCVSGIVNFQQEGFLPVGVNIVTPMAKLSPQFSEENSTVSQLKNPSYNDLNPCVLTPYTTKQPSDEKLGSHKVP